MPPAFARSATWPGRPSTLVRRTLALLVPNQICPSSAVIALLLAAKTDSPGKRLQLGCRAPRVSPVVGNQQTKPHMIITPGNRRWITIDDAVLPVEEKETIPEAGRIGVGQKQLPAAAAIRRLIEARQVARPARQNQNILRVPRPDAAEVQLARARAA